MSKVVVVAVFDSAMQAFGRPFIVPSRGAAERSFQDEVRRDAPDNTMHAHPEDFELFELGLFDEESGVFLNSEGGPRSLLRGKDAAQRKE